MQMIAGKRSLIGLVCAAYIWPKHAVISVGVMKFGQKSSLHFNNADDPVDCSCKAAKGSPEEYYYNPLKCPLPKAPSMQFFCLYGIGMPTERSYYYLNLESDKVSGGLHGIYSVWHALCRRPSIGLQDCLQMHGDFEGPPRTFNLSSNHYTDCMHYHVGEWKHNCPSIVYGGLNLWQVWASETLPCVHPCVLVQT